jgi:aspartate-semialdehyde dehydrogenase
MDILDNIIPYIPGEEAKIPAEARKILGSLNTDLTGFIDQPLHVSVACTVSRCLMAIQCVCRYDS